MNHRGGGAGGYPGGGGGGGGGGGVPMLAHIGSLLQTPVTAKKQTGSVFFGYERDKLRLRADQVLHAGSRLRG